MPIYQRKPFKAQQINSVTDCPSFAYGFMQAVAGECDFSLTVDDKTTFGYFGDYVCQRPDGKLIYICKREIFEICNEPIAQDFPETVVEAMQELQERMARLASMIQNEFAAESIISAAEAA